MEGLSLRPTYGKKQTGSLTSSPDNLTPETRRAKVNGSLVLPHKTEKAEQFDPEQVSNQTNAKTNIYSKSELLELQHLHTDIPSEMKILLTAVPELKQKHTAAKFTPSPKSSSTQKSIKKSEFTHKSKNPWNPLLIQQNPTIRTITGILNKLATDNYARLSIKIVKLFHEISEPEIFREFVALIHNKAVTDFQFILMYTQLCVTLNSTPVSIIPDPGFRKTLLQKCQQDFEDTSLTKKKQIGNIRFVGQLFNHRLLPEKIVHWCFENLLKDVEKNVEHLCILMGTVGKNLDVPIAKNYMGMYFAQFAKYSKNKEMCPRARFMFQDLVELRLRGWVPRSEAKKIEKKKIPEIPQKRIPDIQDIFLDFFSSLDETELATGFKEVKSNKFVESGVLLSLEKSEKERTALIKGFEHLVAKGVLKNDEVMKGMKDIVGQLKELEIDVPNVKVSWKSFVKNAVDAGLVTQQMLPKLIV